jgi:hypothetical protein
LYYTCFLQGGELRLGDAVFLRVEASRAGKNGRGVTCVDAVFHAMGGLRWGCAGPQQLGELLEQGLYLWRYVGGDGGDVGFRKGKFTCLGECAARGRVQDLPPFGVNCQVKMSQKVHAKNGGGDGGQ